MTSRPLRPVAAAIRLANLVALLASNAMEGVPVRPARRYSGLAVMRRARSA
jgi:hypothetical protein